jgi:hypothetical protein
MVAGGSVGGVAVGGKKALVTARQAKVARRSAAADSPMTVFLCFMTYEMYPVVTLFCRFDERNSRHNRKPAGRS